MTQAFEKPPKKKPCRVLLADDDPESRAETASILTSEGYDVYTASDAQEAKHLLLEKGADILLTDWHMPGMSGLQLCRAVRATEAIDFLYIIVFTGRVGHGSLVKALDAGANDFLTKPVNHDELLARLRNAMRIISLQADLAKRNREVLLANARMAIASRDLADANQRLRVLATTDDLTGFLNRREAMARLEKYWASVERNPAPLSVILLDIDRFKRFNDTYGHAVGDLVLREMTKALRKTSRSSDELCRLGGEEFLIVCPNTPEEAAAIAAERFRAAVESLELHHDDQTLAVTISLGVAEKTPAMTGPDDVISAADEALYVAKESGRNCVRQASHRNAKQPTKGAVVVEP